MARSRPQHCLVHAHSNPPSQAVAIVHPKGLEPSRMLSQLQCMLLRTASRTLNRKVRIVVHACSAQIVRATRTACPLHVVGSTLSAMGKLHCLRNHNDTGGRTVQALPRERQVTAQYWRTKNYNFHRDNVIISLPYIG